VLLKSPRKVPPPPVICPRSKMFEIMKMKIVRINPNQLIRFLHSNLCNSWIRRINQPWSFWFYPDPYYQLLGSSQIQIWRNCHYQTTSFMKYKIIPLGIHILHMILSCCKVINSKINFWNSSCSKQCITTIWNRICQNQSLLKIYVSFFLSFSFYIN